MALFNNTVVDAGAGGATSPSATGTNGIDWGGIINTGIGALSNVYDNYINAQMQAAGMANAASAAAQQQQFAYNQQAMLAQMAFNANAARQANELQYKMQQEAMAFNSAEAQKQRTWQEQMSATAYQRAVKDMRAAGINPILAATNGGANVGAGASASISSAKAAQASGSSAGEVGNYTGQGYHLSDTFATFGAILGTIGNIMSALQSNKVGQGVQNYITSGIKDITNGIGNGLQNLDKSLTDWKKESKLWNSAYIRMYRRSWNEIRNAVTKPPENSSGGGGWHYF